MAHKIVEIKEQVIEDLAGGLKIEFKTREDGEFRMYLSSSALPLGNREIHFDKEGELERAASWARGIVESKK